MQLEALMKLLVKKKTLYHLDLSWNNMVETRDTKKYVHSFVNSLRKLIMKSRIFHLDLTGMQLGSNVHRLVEPLRNCLNICSLHLSNNAIPPEIKFYLDRALKIPPEQYL